MGCHNPCHVQIKKTDQPFDFTVRIHTTSTSREPKINLRGGKTGRKTVCFSYDNKGKTHKECSTA